MSRHSVRFQNGIERERGGLEMLLKPPDQGQGIPRIVGTSWLDTYHAKANISGVRPVQSAQLFSSTWKKGYDQRVIWTSLSSEIIFFQVRPHYFGVP